MAKILVVEDDRFLASAFRAKLVKSGFEVRIAYDGVEGLDALNDWLPDLIVLDLVMPEMDGFGFLEVIKQQEVLRSLPIIVMSNLGQQSDIDKALALGANNYISKSELSIGEIVDEVKKYLGNDNGGHAADKA